MSSHSSKKPRVRFDPEVDESNAADTNDPSLQQQQRPRKRLRVERPNADEMDDVDDWEPEDDLDGGKEQGIPSQKDLLEAKKKRRHHDDPDDQPEDTHIDARTSLAAEGVEIEPFHMNDEKSDGTGYFEGDTYIFRKEKEETDAWLDSLDEKASTGVTNGGVSAYVPQPRSKEKSSLGEDMDALAETDIYGKIIPLLSVNETVMQAIVRYGKLLPSRKKGKIAAEVSNKAHVSAKKALDELTAAGNALLLKGQVDIYQKTRANLLALVPKKEQLDRPSVQWEYKGSQDGETHGPYTTLQMQNWINAGYFTGESAVEVRCMKQQIEEKSLQEDLMDDLMDDDDDGGGDSGCQEKTTKVFGEWILSDKVDFSQYC